MKSRHRKAECYRKLVALCTKTKLEKKINLLLQEPGSLTITPTQLFPTLFDVAAHLKASGSIRNYSIEAKYSTSQKFKLSCVSTGRSRKRGCPAYFRVEELEDGQFKLSEAWIYHNHDILELEMDKGVQNVGNAVERSVPVPQPSIVNGGVIISEDEKESDSEEEEDEVEGGTYHEEQDSDVDLKPPVASTSKLSPKSKGTSGLVFKGYWDIIQDVRSLKSYHSPHQPTKFQSKITTLSESTLQLVRCNIISSSSGTGSNKFRMNCSRNSSTIQGSDRCGFTMFIQVKEIIDGEKVWMVESETEHNRACLRSRVEGAGGGEGSGSKGDIVATISRPNTPNSPPLPSNHIDKKPRHSIALPRRLPPPPSTSTSKSKRTIPTNEFTYISISQLSSFLYNLSPVLSHYTQLFYEKGKIETLEDLIDLISMSSNQLEDFLIDLEKREGDGCIKVVQRIAFKNKIADMKRSLKNARK